MPGSTTIFNGRPNSSQQLTRTPIAARVGGGVFVAYSGGYPTTDRALVWRVGTPNAVVLDRAKVNHIVGLLGRAGQPPARLRAPLERRRDRVGPGGRRRGAVRPGVGVQDRRERAG